MCLVGDRQQHAERVDAAPIHSPETVLGGCLAGACGFGSLDCELIRDFSRCGRPVLCTDGADRLSDAQSAVMSYVVAETQRRGMLRVTCPGRAAAEFAKIPRRTAARILKTFTWKGFLIKHYDGRGGPSSTGKAAIYELADPECC